MKKILVTGGAGFIGSNLVEELLNDKNVSLVRVLDNLATGSLKNIEPFRGDRRFEFIEGDIRDYDTCLLACDGIDYISHQAALGSVPRSINDPLTSNNVNITGTLNILEAVKNCSPQTKVFISGSGLQFVNINKPIKETDAFDARDAYSISRIQSVYATRYFRNYCGVKTYIGYFFNHIQAVFTSKWLKQTS